MQRNYHIVFTVTTDLNYDQRMIRICSSLYEAGYEVTIIGMERPTSQALLPKPYHQLRIPIARTQGKLMYIEYWWQLWKILPTISMDAICAIDLDTILPAFYFAKKHKKKIVYDAHEIFTEMQETNSRPIVKKMWETIGRMTVPKIPNGYTIGEAYADFFKKKYNVQYQVVRNATVLRPFEIPVKKERFILYQGAVNKGRAFEYLIPAMKEVEAQLIIIGKGNYYDETAELINKYQVQDKVQMLGYMIPDELKTYTAQAYIGITLFDIEGNGWSNKLSMANRYFDYMHHGVPQLCCDYPEYRKVNERFEIAHLLEDLSPTSIAKGLNTLMNNDSYHQRLSSNAMKAREHYCWQEEVKKLVNFYDELFSK